MRALRDRAATTSPRSRLEWVEFAFSVVVEGLISGGIDAGGLADGL